MTHRKVGRRLSNETVDQRTNVQGKRLSTQTLTGSQKQAHMRFK